MHELGIVKADADAPALLAVLDQSLAETEHRLAKKKEIEDAMDHYRHEHPHDHDDSPKSQDYMNAIKKYTDHNKWPLYVAVHKLAIKLIMLRNDERLSQSKYDEYKKKLLGIDLGSEKLAMDQKQETMNTLIAKLNSGTKMNAIVQHERMMAAMSNRTRTRGGNKSRTPRKQSKTRNRKAVAAAIKDIPLSKARADFAALKAMPCADINQAAKVGNAVMDHYFFRHRLAAKTKRAVSYYDWIRTDWQRNESEHRFYKFNLGQGKTPDKARYAVFRLYYGAIHGFKPLIAKWLYCTYKPRTAVLDFSAGWGGRCLGAMALGIPYIGIDTNVDLRPAYERMVKELDADSESNPNANANVTMRFQDAAATDFSRFKYDMVLTSPPYFKTVRPIEGYAHMPHYADRADFNARFLFPVIRATYSNLARGGTYALNIPDDMYDEIKAAGILPPRLSAKHRLFLQPRFAKGNPNHPDVQYKEHIYVWKKP